MYDNGKGKPTQGSVAGSSSSASAKEAERRIGQRHAITATAEIIDLGSGTRFLTRTSDLGSGGCFVESLNPLPIGTRVSVTVRHNNSEFEIGGGVVYLQIGLGMGIAFDSLLPEQQAELEAWLAAILGENDDPQKKQLAPKIPIPGTGTNATVLRLVQLLVGKRLLTHAEAASVLQEPLL